MSVPSEIKIGPIIFEYDGKSEMYISRGEEVLGMVEYIWPEDWEEFVNAVSTSHSHDLFPVHNAPKKDDLITDA